MEPIRLRLPEGCGDATVRAAVAGARFLTVDSRVVPAKFAVAGGDLVCLRSAPVGGRVELPWPVDGFGVVTVSTATVPVTDEPPDLVTELARGTLGPLRDRLGAWEVAGWRPSAAVRGEVSAARRAFVAAAVGEKAGSPAAALSAVFGAGLTVAAAYGATARAYRDIDVVERQASGGEAPAASEEAVSVGDSRADTVIIGDGSGGPSSSGRAGHAVATPWAVVEPRRGERRWDVVEDALAEAAAEGRAITCGPLVDFRDGALPFWLERLADRPNELASLVADYVESYIGRFGVVVRQWEVVAAVESGPAKPFADDLRLALTGLALKSAHGIAGERPLTLRVAEPDGRHLVDPAHRATPFDFIDHLLRGGVPLSSLTLDFTGRDFVVAGGGDDGSGVVRDSPIDLLRTVDAWRRFDLPLRVAVDASAGEREQSVGDGGAESRATIVETLRRCAGVACVELDRSSAAEVTRPGGAQEARMS
ncbi:MAG: hypothetical protein AAF532_13215 [Planctomycetota bacterium]